MPKTLQKAKYPPHTDDIEQLAKFFDETDTTSLADLEEVHELPERELVSVSLRLPKRDLEVLKRVAAREGLAPTTFMRWVLRRFVRSLATGKA
jgi:predicted DNA binding CopG/RHH family protein